MNKAYSILQVKSLDDAARVIRGIATSPKPDRVGDIVEPGGVKVAADIPLFLYHDSEKTVGRVKFGKPTKDGIPFEATLPTVTESGALRERVEEAWQMVKYRLITGVSIGFRAIEDKVELLKTGGLRFLETEVLELSLVPVPANADAMIQSFKHMDSQQMKSALSIDHSDDLEIDAERKDLVLKLTVKKSAASGVKAIPVKPKSSAGVSAISKPSPKEGTMNIREQIESYQTTRQTKAARQAELMEKSAEDGTTLDASQSEEYDTLTGEIEAIDKHLGRLEVMEKSNVQRSTRVDAAPESPAAVQKNYAVPKAPALKDGLAMAQVVKFLGRAKGNQHGALEMAKAMNNTDARVVAVLKAAVAAGTTTNATWAGALVGEEGGVYADFLEFLRPMTIMGRFGTNGIPALRRVPFRVPLIGQTTGGAGYWVGEGQAKPLTKFDFTRTTLEPLKVANIAVVTEEVLRDSSPSADAIIRDSLVAALRERLDIDFINPAKAAVTGVSPASITNGITAIPSSGTDADAVRNDIAALMGTYIAANNPPTTGVLVMNAMAALRLGLMQNPLGQNEFPGINMNGGSLLNFPVIVSEYVPDGIVVMVNASDIYLGDDGGFAVDMSREASLQMDDAPTMNSTTPTGVSLVSMFQTNSVAFRAERTVSWARRRVSAVAVLSGVAWGVPAEASV